MDRREPERNGERWREERGKHGIAREPSGQRRAGRPNQRQKNDEQNECRGRRRGHSFYLPTPSAPKRARTAARPWPVQLLTTLLLASRTSQRTRSRSQASGSLKGSGELSAALTKS